MQDINTGTPPTAASRQIVTIERGAYWSRVDARVLSEVAPILEYHTQSFLSQHGVCTVRRERHHAGVVIRGVLAIPNGLLSRCQAHLEHLGYTVQLDDHYPHARHSADRSFLQNRSSLSPSQEAFLDAVEASPYGQIVIDSEYQRAEYIAMLIDLYPRNGVLIVTSNARSAKRLVRKLRLTLTRRSISDDIREPAGRPNTLVCPGNIAQPYTADEFQIVIFADINVAAWKQFSVLHRLRSGLSDYDCQVAEGVQVDPIGILEPGWRNGPKRVYGFLYRDQQLDPLKRLEYESTVGPIIAGAERTIGAQEVDVIVDNQDGAMTVHYATTLDRKKAEIWENSRWNSKVVEVATACAQQDRNALDRLGIELPEFGGLWNDNPGQPTTVVLVESPAHGRELAKLLPDWRVIHHDNYEAVDAHAEPLSPERAIVTLLAATRVRLAVNIIIRADGTDTHLRSESEPDEYPNRSAMLIVNIRRADR
jgi:hypothetical protein